MMSWVVARLDALPAPRRLAASARRRLASSDWPRRRTLPRFLGRLGLRSRLGFAAGLAVALVVGLVSVLGYLVVRHELVADVDRQLQTTYFAIQHAPVRRFDPRLPADPRRGGASVQWLASDGSVAQPPTDGGRLPVNAQAQSVAAGDAAGYLSDVTSDGVHLRMYTGPAPGGGAVQVALPMTDVDGQLNRLAVKLGYVGLAGLMLAVGLNWFVGRRVLTPVERLTQAAEQISSTMDLSHRIDAAGPHELRRLAVSFNAMLDAVSAAVDAQRQLVADASHELRTPLTSLRTNVELLARAQRLPPADRTRLVGRIDAGLAELGGLVTDIVDLARGEEQAPLITDVALDAITHDAVERAGRHRPEVEFRLVTEPVLIRAVADRVARAVTNLLDNAAKFSPPGASVDVTVRSLDGGAVVQVRDHGPGVAPADLPRVFDRFYRSADARQVPGAGLGLAIVGQVARSHNGWARLEQAEGGGARASLWLPGIQLGSC